MSTDSLRKGAVASEGKVPASPPRPGGVPDSFIQGNHYMRELVDRLFMVADAARAYYDTASPRGIGELEARMRLRWALRRLDGDA